MLIGCLFILPSFSGILVFAIIPFFASLYYSFTSGIGKIEFVGLGNFIELFKNPTFMLAVKNTLIFIGIGVPLLLILSLGLSLSMMNAPHVFARWALLIPLIIPTASVIGGWNLILGVDGFISRLAVHLGLESINFLDEKFAMEVIILLYIWKNMGYLAVVFTSAISTIPKEYKEVYLLESKSEIRMIRMVILPLIAPIAFFAIIISVMNSFKLFREVYVMYGSMPPKNIYMLQHFMNNNFFKLNYQRLATAAIILIGILSMLIWLILKLQRHYTRDL